LLGISLPGSLYPARCRLSTYDPPMRALVGLLALALAAGGAAFTLWFPPHGSTRSQAKTSRGAHARGGAYCVEDNEDGRWFHFEGGTGTIAIKPGACPVHGG